MGWLPDPSFYPPVRLFSFPIFLEAEMAGGICAWDGLGMDLG